MPSAACTFDYVQGIDISEFNYAPYVQQMKDKGIEYVQIIGAYRSSSGSREAMKQQGFTPKVFMLDPTAYNPDYVEQRRRRGRRAPRSSSTSRRSRRPASNKELQLYLSWLQQVKPGATPDASSGCSPGRPPGCSSSGRPRSAASSPAATLVAEPQGRERLDRQRPARAAARSAPSRPVAVLALHPPQGRQVVAGRRHEVPVQRHHDRRADADVRTVCAPRHLSPAHLVDGWNVF